MTAFFLWFSAGYRNLLKMVNDKNNCYNSDTTLIHLARAKMRNLDLKNLQIRNGIFYLRCTINKRKIYKSLNTDNPQLARFLANKYMLQILSNPDNPPDISKELLQISCFLDPSNSQYLQVQQDSNTLGSIQSLGISMARTKKHKIIDIWESIPHNAGKLYLSTCKTRLTRAIELLGVEYIEDLAKDPVRVTTMIDKFPTMTQAEGKNKGQPLSRKYCQETIKLLRTTTNRAADLGYIHNESDILKKLRLPKYIQDNIKKPEEQEPFSPDDFDIIFNQILPLFWNKKKLAKFKKTVSDLSPSTEEERAYKTALERVASYPYVFFYYILILLYTGSRANIAATLRHTDVEVLQRHKYLYFHIDKDLVDQGDIRETVKLLKGERNNPAPESARKVPIAQKIYLNGFNKYITKHLLKYGKEAFIFEEALITRNNTYRVKNLQESINALLRFYNIKPPANSGKLKTVHSCKTSFYSCNSNLSPVLMHTIAGNKMPCGDVVNKHYLKVSYDNNMKELESVIDQIKYPHDMILIYDILFTGVFILLLLDSYGFPIRWF